MHELCSYDFCIQCSMYEFIIMTVAFFAFCIVVELFYVRHFHLSLPTMNNVNTLSNVERRKDEKKKKMKSFELLTRCHLTTQLK